jgi:endonuclease-3
MVNKVTEKLFKKYTTLADYVDADLAEFEQDIRSTGFYRNKAKNILAAARMVHETFHGKIPSTMADMLTIPGVARKTANVVLGNAHGVVEGIAVDTHVRRLCLKFDLTDHRDPKKIEQDLMSMVSKKDWFLLTYLFIEYGRQMCPARRHPCEDHPLTKLYPAAASRWPKAK